MIRSSIITLSYLTIFFSAAGAFADDTIKVHVKTNERTTAALGFVVEGKKCGSAGKSYAGKGPTNKKYTFGYRRHSLFSSDIICGSKILTKDSKITLVILGKNCSIEIEKL